MTTRREYAASLGLAKPNTRGRLSKEAHAAIAAAEAEGMVFDDNKPKAANLDPSIPVTQQTAVRQARAYRATTESGQVIEFGHCSGCKNHVMYCKCQNGPTWPGWLSDVDIWEAVL